MCLHCYVLVLYVKDVFYINTLLNSIDTKIIFDDNNTTAFTFQALLTQKKRNTQAVHNVLEFFLTFYLNLRSTVKLYLLI